MPAVYALAMRRLLPERFAVVGVARTQQSTEDWVAAMEDAVREYGRDRFREDIWRELAGGMRYVSTEFDDASGEDTVASTLAELDEERGSGGNRLFYFAVPPEVIGTLVRGDRRAARAARAGRGSSSRSRSATTSTRRAS